MIHFKKTLTALALISMLSACSETAEVVERSAPNVKVATVETESSTGDLFYPAVASAANKAPLSFKVSGELVSISVKEGDLIQKGQVIAEIDASNYQLEVDNARARFQVIDNQYTRSKPLVEKGLLAKSQFDEIAAQRQIALADLSLAELRLSYTKLRAPFSGVVSRILGANFESIQAGQAILNINSIDSVEVIVQLPDRLYANKPSMETFQDIVVTVKTGGGNEYASRIKAFTTEPDPDFGTYTVTLIMPMPSDELIFDGMPLEVTTRGENAGVSFERGLSVPIEAVFNGDGDGLSPENSFVWVVGSDNKVTKKQVNVIKASRDTLLIDEGLKIGDQVVTAGMSRLFEGHEVVIVAKEVNDE